MTWEPGLPIGYTRSGSIRHAHIDPATLLPPGAAAVTAAALASGSAPALAQVTPCDPPRRTRRNYKRRGRDCFAYRVKAAKLARARNKPLLVPQNNGEEEEFSACDQHLEDLELAVAEPAERAGGAAGARLLEIGGRRRLPTTSLRYVDIAPSPCGGPPAAFVSGRGAASRERTG
jgi:hypothetical protein